MNIDIFTQEELAIIKTYSVQQSTWKVFSFYACILFAPIAFALYGLINEDALAVFISVVGLLVFIAWWSATQMKNEKVINRIFQKVLELEN